MAQYINKSAVVAEIERLISIYNDDENIHHIAKYNILVDILSFLDTLEVKEVDLEKEIKKIYLKHRQYGGNKNILVVLNELQFNDIAKHFYEIGLKTQKGE